MFIFSGRDGNLVDCCFRLIKYPPWRKQVSYVLSYKWDHVSGLSELKGVITSNFSVTFTLLHIFLIYLMSHRNVLMIVAKSLAICI